LREKISTSLPKIDSLDENLTIGTSLFLGASLCGEKISTE